MALTDAEEKELRDELAGVQAQLDLAEAALRRTMAVLVGARRQVREVADFLYQLTALLGLPDGTEMCDILETLRRSRRS